MQGIKLLSAFGGIDEKYVLEAEQPFPKKRRYPVSRWAGIAAGICLMLGLAFAATVFVKQKMGVDEKKGKDVILSEKGTDPGRENNAGKETDLDKENASGKLADQQELSVDPGIIRDFDTFDTMKDGKLQKIDPSGTFSGDLGTGMLTAKKVSELIDNPAGASEDIAKIKTMPVYRKKKKEDELGFLLLSEEDMEEGEEYLTEIAERLRWDIDGIERETNVQAEGTQVVSLLAECKQGSMELDAEGTLYVDGLKFVPEQGKKTEDFVAETMQRLQCISGFSKTKVVYQNSYDYDGKKSCDYCEAYEEEGNLKEQIQNCGLSSMLCYMRENGTMHGIYLHHYRKSTVCLGEYPIISRKKAEKLLSQGKYLSQYPEKLSADAKVAACELTYAPEINSQVLIPYYSFQVEVPGRQEDEEMGLKTFANFYVPAVKEKYFKDSFQWEFAVD